MDVAVLVLCHARARVLVKFVYVDSFASHPVQSGLIDCSTCNTTNVWCGAGRKWEKGKILINTMVVGNIDEISQDACSWAAECIFIFEGEMVCADDDGNGNTEMPSRLKSEVSINLSRHSIISKLLWQRPESKRLKSNIYEQGTYEWIHTL